jgi:hypothetical protein
MSDVYRQPNTVEEARGRRAECLKEMAEVIGKIAEWKGLNPTGRMARASLDAKRRDAKVRLCWLQKESARLKNAIPLCLAKENAKVANVNDPDSLIRAAHRVLHRLACELEGDIDAEEQQVINALRFYCEGFGRRDAKREES